MTDRHIEVSGYAGYWVASCWCGWVGTAHRSRGPLNASDKARREADSHTCKPRGLYDTSDLAPS